MTVWRRRDLATLLLLAPDAAEALLRAPPRAGRHAEIAARIDTSEDLLQTEPSASPSLAFSVSLLSSIRDVAQAEWDEIASRNESPFSEWGWLHSLEASGCACAETGWTPYHMVVRHDDSSRLVAAVPMYLKSHSLGEFAADAPWVDLAQQRGVQYYPKLLCAVPFTPVEGSRVLLSPELSAAVRAQLLLLVAKYLRTLAQQNGLASVHANFCTDEEVAAFSQAGFLQQQSMQYHWWNAASAASGGAAIGGAGKGSGEVAALHVAAEPADTGPTGGDGGDGSRGAAAWPASRTPYRHFDDYLSSFRSKRRMQIRRERAAVAKSGVATRVLTGEQVRPEMMALIFHLYKRTVERNVWGQQYLNERFFTMLVQWYRERLCIVLALQGDEVVGATLNVLKDGVLYGRYWGSLHGGEERYPFLHFETCYYAPLEHAIEQGWQRFEPGAGTPDSRLTRGFQPVRTHSVHLFCDVGLHREVAERLQSQRQRQQSDAEQQNSPAAQEQRTVLCGSEVFEHRVMLKGSGRPAHLRQAP